MTGHRHQVATVGAEGERGDPPLVLPREQLASRAQVPDAQAPAAPVSLESLDTLDLEVERRPQCRRQQSAVAADAGDGLLTHPPELDGWRNGHPESLLTRIAFPDGCPASRRDREQAPGVHTKGDGCPHRGGSHRQDLPRRLPSPLHETPWTWHLPNLGTPLAARADDACAVGAEDEVPHLPAVDQPCHFPPAVDVPQVNPPLLLQGVRLAEPQLKPTAHQAEVAAGWVDGQEGQVFRVRELTDFVLVAHLPHPRAPVRTPRREVVAVGAEAKLYYLSRMPW